MSYDRIDWHSGGNYPDGLPSENGGTHIGMFLAWAILRGLEGAIHHEDATGERALADVRGRRMTGRQFLEKRCGGKFWEVDLNDEGNGFARDYYVNGRYLDDYGAVLVGDLPSAYHVEDTWKNFDKLAAVLDRRYREWESASGAKR